MYPKFVKLQENFHKDAKFECSLIGNVVGDLGQESPENLNI